MIIILTSMKIEYDMGRGDVKDWGASLGELTFGEMATNMTIISTGYR